MLPNRPANEGPLARSAREAFESAVSPDVAVALLHDALLRADLTAVPEGVDAFYRFCAGPLRTAMHVALSPAAIEQVLERLGHVLWMASGDPAALERARTWVHPLSERDDDSGVRHVDVREHAPTDPAMTAVGSRPRSASDSRPGGDASDSRPRSSDSRPRDGARESSPDGTSASDSSPRRWASQPRPAAVIEAERTVSGSQPRLEAASSPARVDAMPAPTLPAVSGTGVTLGRMRAMSGRLPAVEQGPGPDRTSDPGAGRTSDPGAHRSSDPGVLRPGSAPRTRSMPVAPSAVLALTLDERLLSELRAGMAMHCPVRPIAAPPELAGALVTSGDRIVVLIDTALPSIDVRTFAGLTPILPPGTRVVLLGATTWQHERLVALVPAAAAWVLGPTDVPIAPYLLALPAS